MHLIIILVTPISFLTLGVNAARLVIYTSVAKPLTLVTLKKDWTLDTTSKAENLVRWPQYQPMQIPKGGGSDFEVSAVIDWDGDRFDEKRAFWVTDDEDPIQSDSPKRGFRSWTKGTVQSTQEALGKDVFVFLSHKDLVADPSWTWSAEDDWLDRGWLHCIGRYGEWEDKFFTKPDDTWS